MAYAVVKVYPEAEQFGVITILLLRAEQNNTKQSKVVFSRLGDIDGWKDRGREMGR